MEDRDFIDFEFNGHWASEFNLLAVSNSDRYSNSFYGTVNANTADMVGKYGVYKWKTQIGEKRFSINIAYDNVDLNTLRKIKEWLNPFVIGKLVFKEEPYKYYWVSLAEDPEISFLPFLTEEIVVDGRRLKKGVYKGEFVINFVCFDNYGYSDWNSFDENYDYIVKELEISDDEVNFDDGSDNSLIISQIDGNLKQNKESQAYYSTSQESNSLTLNNITNTDTEKWSIKGGNSQVVQNYNSIQVESESFDLNDVDNSKTMDIQLKGNHNQEMREGYNLLDFNVAQDSKVTVNEDGTITINGTGGFSLFFATVKFKTKTYSMKWQLVSGTAIENSNHFIMIPGGTVWADKDVFTQFSFAEEKSYSSLWISAGAMFTNARIKIWIYEGTEEKPYEPYGASPSPDFPSEIKAVGSNVNLFDKDSQDMFLKGLIPNNAGEIQAVTTDTSASKYLVTIIVPCLPNLTYIISRYAEGKTFFVYESSKKDLKVGDNVTFLKRNDNTGVINEKITTGANAKYLLVKIYNTFTTEQNTYNDLISSVKIEQGTVATPYSPYGQGCINVVICNKNLFNISNNTVTASGLTAIIENGIVSLGGTSTSTSFLFLIRNKLSLKAGTYTISTFNNNISSDDTTDLRITHRNGDGIIARAYLNNTNVSFTFTLDTDLEEGCLQIRSGSRNTFNNFVIKPQLELGSSATSFVQHEEQSYILPVQQDMLEGDYFDFDREKEIHGWNLLSFTGNEAWSLLSGATSVFLLGNVSGQTYGGHNFSMCTHFKYDTRTAGMANLQDETFAMQYEYSALYVKCNKFTTVEEWKAYLKSQYENGTPIKLAYITANITELSFTSEQKIVARQLKRSNFYKGTTNVILDNDLAKVKVNYDGYDGAPSEKHPSSVDGVKSKVDIIISNQNLFNFNKLNTSNSNLTIANNKLSGNNSVAIIGASNDSKGLLNKILVPGTYTVSFDILSKTDNWINSAFLCCQNQQKAENYANGISVNLIANEKKRASFQFEVKEKMTQFGIVFYLSKVSEYEVSNITVVKGTEEDYIEYKQQQISLPVQEEMYIGDYIDETGEHHKMAKIVIDGTNTRVSMTKKSLNNYIQTYLSTSQQFDPQVDINCYSNIMKQEYNARFGFVNTFIKGKTGIYFHFKGDLLGDADCNDIGMNNWFKEQYDKGTPAYIIGPLKKEKVLPLTDEQKSALNILKNYTYSYPGANTISISGDTKPKITASYIPQQDINIDFVLEGSNLLNDSAFYYNNDIYLKAFDEIDSGNPSTSGISSEREVYLYNAGNADASLKLTFDLIIPAENSPLTIVTSKGHFTKNGFEEINSYSQFSISNFAHYKPFVDIFDGVLSNWVIEIDSDLCEVYLKHKTNKDKVISLNRFNDNQSFLKLAGSDFVDYSKSFPTSLEEIKDSAIENTIFNKISLKESAQNYRLKNVSLDWKHTYL